MERLTEIHRAIQVGADAFLAAECMCAILSFELLVYVNTTIGCKSAYFITICFSPLICWFLFTCPVSDGACLGFVVVFGAVVYGLVAIGQSSFVYASYTTAAFVLGALTSIFSGWVGMKVR